MEEILHQMQSEIPEIKVIEKQFNSITIECQFEGIVISLKSNAFTDEGFEDFAIFESYKKLEINDLIKCDEPLLTSKYKEGIENDLGELIIMTEEDCKKYKVRTVIHCSNEDLLEMFKELLSIHLNIHKTALN